MLAASLLLRRRMALESLLGRPHAITCLVAGLDCRGVDTQCRVAGILLRIALIPSGLRLMLTSWDSLRDTEADEPRLSHLISILRTCRSLQFCLSLLRLLVVMLEGPADTISRTECAKELEGLGLLQLLERSRYSLDPRFEDGANTLKRALSGEGSGGIASFTPPITSTRDALMSLLLHRRLLLLPAQQNGSCSRPYCG